MTIVVAVVVQMPAAQAAMVVIRRPAAPAVMTTAPSPSLPPVASTSHAANHVPRRRSYNGPCRSSASTAQPWVTAPAAVALPVEAAVRATTVVGGTPPAEPTAATATVEAVETTTVTVAATAVLPRALPAVP